MAAGRRVFEVWVGTLLAVALVLTALVVPAAPAAAQAFPACPTAFPVADVTPGLEAQGLTVSSGTTPEAFDVEVVDVLQDAIAPGVPLIVVETDSAALDAAGGIWAGMSGSPVYVDGQLLGAVGYGFSLGPSKLGGVTPAAAMLAVPNLPPRPDLAAADLEVPVSPQVRAAAIEDGVAASAAGSMAPLRVPVRVSGPRGAKLDRFTAALEDRYPGIEVVRGASGSGTGAASTEVVPGGNLGVSLSYGDYTAAGVGTVTTRCGDTITGFGHPMLWDGATRLGLHGASAVTVVRDSTLGPYKLANAGPVVGTIGQDRLAAVAGTVGTLPATTAITTSITNTDTGVTTPGRTDAVHPDDLFFPVLVHGWINYDAKVLDDWGFSGTSEVAWTIRGTRAGGAPFELTRSDRHADRYDLSTESLVGVAAAAQQLLDNPFERVRVTEVDYQASAGSPYRADTIVSSGVRVRVDGGEPQRLNELYLEAGSQLSFSVPLRRFQDAANNRTVTIDLTVPQDVAGYGELVLSGGSSVDDPFECLWDPEYCAQADGDSFEGLIEAIEDAPRQDELTATLLLWPDEFGSETSDEPEDDGTVVVRARRQLDTVVRGEAYGSVVVDPPFVGDPCDDDLELPFPDVSPTSAHRDAIACAALLGIVKGTAEVPPRFLPERSVRRDQAAAMLARTLDLGPRELPDVDRATFDDVRGSTHERDVARLAAAGIVNGRNPRTFDPLGDVTREQMASMVVRSLRWSTGLDLEPEDGPYFDDVLGGVHADNVDVGYELGLWQGDGRGRFRPRASTRRDQLATMVVNLLRVEQPWG
jgi:hypothetical protein